MHERLYLIGGPGEMACVVIGLLELAVIVGFLLGVRKMLPYGIVLALHAVSMLSSWQQHLGFDNLLFFAAWPMLAACCALPVVRDLDTKFTLAKFA